MNSWKFTDNTNKVVYKTNSDGSMESCSVEAIQDWIDAGNMPSPADPVLLLPMAIIPAYIFRDRFTEAELIAINALAYSGNAEAQLLLLKVSTATDGIDLASKSVADGLNYLVSVGAITSDRLPALLAPI
jgi:hypothetical protein